MLSCANNMTKCDKWGTRSDYQAVDEGSPQVPPTDL
jgi:hypothetical protein